MIRTISALVRSAHPGPTLVVTTITVILGASITIPMGRLAVLGTAMMLGQAAVGLSNDVIDADRDKSVGRKDKPLAAGEMSRASAGAAAIVAACIAVALTISLGWAATVTHVIFITAGFLYNAGLKNSVFSVAPYLLGFGLLPLIITLSRSEPACATPWALLTGALLGVAAHFANVLPDLDDDKTTGIQGLPHRLGAAASGVIIAMALAGASASTVLGAGSGSLYQYAGLGLSLILASYCAQLALRGKQLKLIFSLVIVGALIDVVLLCLAGTAVIS
ncbi:MAG: UbiA family prenyltransferase [Rhodoglobus sp.]